VVRICSRARYTSKARKYFFFEKKKQKTIGLLMNAAETAGTDWREQKFFGSFFQKRTAFLTLAFPSR
jgi:hypothetical protein